MSYTDSREMWNEKMKVGDKMTVPEMACAITGKSMDEIDSQDKKIVSSFMSHANRKGYAEKDGNRPAGYIKVTSVPGRGGYHRKDSADVEAEVEARRKVVDKPKGDLDALQVGNAILAVIEKLTNRNKELRDSIKFLNAEITDAVKAKQEIAGLYQKAQERILELNQATGKGRKTVNLHELQSLTKSH